MFLVYFLFPVVNRCYRKKKKKKSKSERICSFLKIFTKFALEILNGTLSFCAVALWCSEIKNKDAKGSYFQLQNL